MKYFLHPHTRGTFSFVPLCAALFMLGLLPALCQAKLPSIPASSALSSKVVFIENKGQVHDQNGNTRSDILFSGATQGFVYHLKKDGISYQLVRSLSPAGIPAGQHRSDNFLQSQIKTTIYRLDIEWPGANPHASLETGQTTGGLTNFYQGTVPDGIIGVRSFEDVTLKNIYTGIDLHYYSREGYLKYDYLVAAHADYTQIQLRIKGASNIRLQPDGSVLLSTPLGDIREGTPLVYQAGKQIGARWIVKNNILTFELQGYDPELPLIIDPVTRAWGTYYGGTGNDYASSICTDASGNVFMAGSTNTSGGTVIATSGSHQTAFAGQFDGFMVMFNSSGVRLWATYYGGSANDFTTDCSVDNLGNCYFSGSTQSAGLSTTGAHQTANGGGALDGFLTKFNSSGVRQWCTYYGGSFADDAASCTVDMNGDIIISGITQSSTNISSTGSHQTAFGGGNLNDAYVAKFNSSGVRLWGTYYGTLGDDWSYDCTTDGSANIYISGATTSTVNIATAGSHQNTYGGGTSRGDAFLVKFNPAGVRQWGTYYGGTNDELGFSVQTDAAGNVYLGGQTASNNNISTTGSHQPAFGGGTDGFIAKFNSAGVRQWGTYYGGAGNDNIGDCSVDAAGNIYFSGTAASTSGISTPGSYQAVYGGGTNDAHFEKFNTSGILQWGSYYGDSGDETGGGSAIDVNGFLYFCGRTTSPSGTVIATPGSHQATTGGGTADGFLAKFSDCNIPSAPVNVTAAGNLTLCSGSSTTLSATASGPIDWYATGASTTVLSTGGTFVTPVLTSGTYTYYAATTNTCSQSIRTAVTLTVGPVLTVNSGAICAGGSFTIVPGGAVSYTFSGGSAVVSPNVPSSYTVTGKDLAGCTGTIVSTVNVNALPVITVNSGTICTGNSFTIQPSGASTYTYSGGTAFVSPVTTSTYAVTGTDVNGCTNTSAVISTVVVNALPTLTASSSHTLTCKGEPVNLSVSGAVNYTWVNTGATSTLITVSPTISTNYTITGTDANSCTNKFVLLQSVKACTGLSDNIIQTPVLLVIPNPGNGHFNVSTSFISANTTLEVFNAIGQRILSEKLSSGHHELNLTSYANGVYFLRILENNEITSQTKILKE